jgi:hypothetical protein
VSQPASERSDPGEPSPPPEGEPQRAQEPVLEPLDTPPDRVVAINRATLRGVDFRKARFDSFALAGCVFISCDFRAIRFDKKLQGLFTAAPHSTFRDCKFDGADLRRVRPGLARFERCTFDDTAIDGWRTEAAELVDCRFAGALGTVVFYARPAGNAGHLVAAERKRNEFTGNDFRDADLDHVTFTGGIDLRKQRLPRDDRYVWLDRFPQRVARARTDIVRWDVQEERIAALDMLRDLTTRFRDQSEVFASRMTAEGAAARVQTRVWAELERAFA